MQDQKEKYLYENYLPELKGATIKEVPCIEYELDEYSDRNALYLSAEATSDTFMAKADRAQDTSDFDDFFGNKVQLSKDRIELILGEIRAREAITYRNLADLYDDLLKLDNWRLERPFPDNYKKDKIWEGFNKAQFQIRDQIRRELKDAARDTAFTQKDLREGILELTIQKQKKHMVEGGLEMSLEGSYQIRPGDLYQPQKPP